MVVGIAQRRVNRRCPVGGVESPDFPVAFHDIHHRSAQAKTLKDKFVEHAMPLFIKCGRVQHSYAAVGARKEKTDVATIQPAHIL